MLRAFVAAVLSQHCFPTRLDDARLTAFLDEMTIVCAVGSHDLPNLWHVATGDWIDAWENFAAHGKII